MNEKIFQTILEHSKYYTQHSQFLLFQSLNIDKYSLGSKSLKKIKQIPRGKTTANTK